MMLSGANDLRPDSVAYLVDRVRSGPYGALGAAAAVGYVLGGGLRTPLTLMMLAAASRIAGAQIVRELAALAERENARASAVGTADMSGGLTVRHNEAFRCH
jgi:hypothetical protein